ncbi:MAG: segregation/condensation protein A [Candidatus Kerfeldbacteria bacterium]|nr:segregation/condensation protein A [Candidatus Kerfeldbacteria bacterium]
MTFQVQLQQFQGPFDVLLQLIEQRELAITEISLATITAEFIQQLDTVEDHYPDELADFLIVASRLLYLKSRALLPYLEPDDDEPPGQLAERLKLYREFRDAAEQLEQRLRLQQFAVERPSSLARQVTVEFSPPPGITAEHLSIIYKNVLGKLDTPIRLPQAAIRKAVTLKEKIMALASVLEQYREISFASLTNAETDRLELVITFLAVLELVKQNLVTVRQTQPYSDIIIKQL